MKQSSSWMMYGLESAWVFFSATGLEFINLQEHILLLHFHKILYICCFVVFLYPLPPPPPPPPPPPTLRKKGYCNFLKSLTSLKLKRKEKRLSPFVINEKMNHEKRTIMLFYKQMKNIKLTQKFSFITMCQLNIGQPFNLPKPSP